MNDMKYEIKAEQLYKLIEKLEEDRDYLFEKIVSLTGVNYNDDTMRRIASEIFVLKSQIEQGEKREPFDPQSTMIGKDIGKFRERKEPPYKGHLPKPTKKSTVL
jgi:hypothetical protein